MKTHATTFRKTDVVLVLISAWISLFVIIHYFLLPMMGA